MDFAFVAGDTVYVGHYQRELDEFGVLEMYHTHCSLRWEHVRRGTTGCWATRRAAWHEWWQAAHGSTARRE